MAKNPSSAYRRAYIERVRSLRARREWTQLQMAIALDISLDAYKKYEGPSMLPHHLIERFCLIVGCDIEYLITGREKPKRARTKMGKGDNLSPAEGDDSSPQMMSTGKNSV